MEKDEILIQIHKDILDIKKTLRERTQFVTISDNWLPRSEVMKYLSYGNTQMGQLEKRGDLIVTKVGKRKFILKQSLEKLLQMNIESNPMTRDYLNKS